MNYIYISMNYIYIYELHIYKSVYKCGLPLGPSDPGLHHIWDEPIIVPPYIKIKKI